MEITPFRLMALGLVIVVATTGVEYGVVSAAALGGMILLMGGLIWALIKAINEGLL